MAPALTRRSPSFQVETHGKVITIDSDTQRAASLGAAVAQPGGSAGPGPVAPAPSATPLATSDPKRVRHQWIQTPTHVLVTIFVQGVTDEDVSVTYEPSSLEVAVKLPRSDAEYQLHLSLFASVRVEECSHKVGSMKVEISLKKSVAGTWDDLEGSGEGGEKLHFNPAHGTSTVAEPPAQGKRPAYPTSRPKKVDWDQVESAVKKEEAEEKLEGDAALNKLFGEIYQNADEDTRRAMVKSMQTSGGTVLSTNWSEVKDKDYEKERSAPEGQEWKKWD